MTSNSWHVKLSWNLASVDEAIRPIPETARLLACSDCGSESRRGYGRLFLRVSGRGLCDGLIPRPEESYECVCVCVCVSFSVNKCNSNPLLTSNDLVHMGQNEKEKWNSSNEKFASMLQLLESIFRHCTGYRLVREWSNLAATTVMKKVLSFILQSSAIFSNRTFLKTSHRVDLKCLLYKTNLTVISKCHTIDSFRL